MIRPQRNQCCLLLNVPKICLPAVYGISDKEFLHPMYITVRIQSEDPASYELMKQLDAEVEDNLGIHSGRDTKR
jgi:hypothetical protein